MKTVDITIVGTVLVCEYCSQSLYNNDEYEDNDEAFYSQYYCTNG